MMTKPTLKFEVEVRRAIYLLTAAAAACTTTQATRTPERIQSQPRTPQQLDSACDHGDGGACYRLGYLLCAGRGVEKNLSNAADAYRRGCNVGHRFSCDRLAFAFDKGVGVEADKARAVELYTKTCELGMHRACGDAALVLMRQPSPDIERAIPLFERACAGIADQLSCKAVAQLSADPTALESAEWTRPKGCLKAPDIKRVIEAAHATMRDCYTRALAKNRDLTGKVTTYFVIGASGYVFWAEVTDTTLENDAVEQCLVDEIYALRFPPCESGGTADVTYPWIFKTH